MHYSFVQLGKQHMPEALSQPTSALQYTDFPQKCLSNASRSDITASLRPPCQLEAQVCTTCAVINISDNIPVLFSKLVWHPCDNTTYTGDTNTQSLHDLKCVCLRECRHSLRTIQ